jgi:DNA-3-methyladenine glycosylase
MKLKPSFYQEFDALAAARHLLGKVLVAQDDDGRSAGIIAETEAYMGRSDRASHAYGGKRTQRNASMYRNGGIAYVYLCYGIHHLFNVVVREIDEPQAVLIRAVIPRDGVARMNTRRNGRSTTNGPGTLTQALGITTADNGTDLNGQRIWIEDRGIWIPDEAVTTGPRIGVEYAGSDALLPYRFRFAPSHLQGK